MGLNINVNVDDKATPMLKEFNASMTPELKHQIAMAIAEAIYSTAMDMCPSPSSNYFPTDSTGNLRDSHEFGPEGEGAKVSATADYALYVHEGHYVVGGKFGTRIAGETDTASRKKSYEFVPPRPWMTMAIEATDADQIAQPIIYDALLKASGETTDISGTEMAPEASTVSPEGGEE